MLLLKRRNLPFMVDPGIWTFVAGGKKRSESYDDRRYREIEERDWNGEARLGTC